MSSLGAHRRELPRRAFGERKIGFVDHQHIGDFEDAGLDRLHVVAQSRCIHHHAHIGDLGDLDFRLAGADGFHHHDIAARSVEDVDHARRRARQSAEMAAAGERPDEHARIGGMLRHADTVAQNGAAGERRRRIDRDDADALAALAQLADIGRDQRGLAGTRRAGEADHQRMAEPAADRLQHQPRLVGFVLDRRDGPGQRRPLAGQQSRQPVRQDG